MPKMIGLFRLGGDAVIRYTSDGTAVAGMSLAYNYGKRDNDEQPTQWIQGSLWGKRAEPLAPYLTKGSLFLMELNDIHVEIYDKRDNGGQGVNLVGRIENIEFTGKQDSNGSEATQASSKSEQKAKPGAADDEVPF